MAKAMNNTQRNHLINRLRTQLTTWRNQTFKAIDESKPSLRVYSAYTLSAVPVDQMIENIRTGEFVLLPGSNDFKVVPVADAPAWEAYVLRKAAAETKYDIANEALEKIIDDLIFKDVGEVSSVMDSFAELLK